MTCRELTAFLDDYLAGELPAETRERFEAHLTACPNCHVYLTQYKRPSSSAAGPSSTPTRPSCRPISSRQS